MAASRSVEWTARAERDLERIHAFILSRWSEREADRLLDLVQQFELFVVLWPSGFRRSAQNKHLRLGFVHWNTTAVYRVYRDRIVIVALFDKRSNATW